MNSYWSSTVKKDDYKKLEDNAKTEVCIIGGGLTGLTTAYYLTKEGIDVVLLEKSKICSHTSGNTTAKITSQHGIFYKYLIDSVGEEQAKQYLKANEKAIKNIEKIVKEENIECDFEKQDSYVYTQSNKDVKKIQEEVKALHSLGFKSEYVEKIEAPLQILGAIKFKDQAQFNPVKYAKGLAESITKRNGKIYENMKVIDVKSEDGKYKIITEDGKLVQAKYVVIATHYPIINIPGFYFMKMYQSTSYIVAVDPKEEVFTGMYINSESPTLSLRTTKDGLVLFGGMDHKTGAKIDLQNSYKNLEEKAKQIYPNCEVKYRWNSEDCISLDKIPYIGEFSNLMPNVYVGTGYKKWGMTTSNISANIITSKILGKKNKYEEVFKATRLKPIKNYEELGNMIKEVGNSLILNKLKNHKEYFSDLKEDEGKILEIDGEKLGAYKDKNGKMHVVKPICTHLGCELSWNNLDKTWDCPCHGSRFTYEGISIYDPSIKNLQVLDYSGLNEES